MSTETPWHAAFPAPQSTPATAARTEVKQWLEDSPADDPPKFVLVDLRRTDHEGGTIRGSLNLPAQNLYPSLPTLYAVFKAAGVRKVVFYCGSCGGRGTRAGGWFADFLKEKGVPTGEMESLILEGGIKGWVKAGEEYTGLMEGFVAEAWG